MLGLQHLCQNATVEDIKQAFRRKAVPFHPALASASHGQGPVTADEALFEEVVAAYKVLRDPGRREAYDA